MEEQKKEFAIRVLQAQINPHFLYNTLNTIDYMVDVGRKEDTHEIISILVALLKSALNRSGDMVPLSEELRYLKDYAALMNYRYADKFQLEISVPKQHMQYRVPKLILQPLVENALFHGLSPLDGVGTVCVNAYDDEDFFKISVQDNGVGIPSDKLSELTNLDAEKADGSVGLWNVNIRIKTHYGDLFGISVYSKEGMGTTVIIRLPQHVAANEEAIGE